ncbi:hypothetical protein K402DRAFT_456547 [Aulographum hederae CBS 113979]|uniref:Rhodanese domain-containing protein n=1 Tax=Aulographum hederae CBS 113979 TaxID=1176131 RepID=A0A6G1GS04_9PEZI|nr:hypothetical protein K402DRAFT_456547 [Aulographum hederae CBS 113979]
MPTTPTLPKPQSTSSSTPTSTFASSPQSYPCTCPHGPTSGTILLFYRYYAASPSLPFHHLPRTQSRDCLEELARWHERLWEELNLAGRGRVAGEGFNISVAGGREEVEEYIRGEGEGEGEEEDEEGRRGFWKPTRGCACVFGGERRVQVKNEITPMGVEGWVPRWELEDTDARGGGGGGVTSLEPRVWHRMCVGGEGGEGEREGEEVQLLDVRNHYESRIGYFVTGKGEPALRPGIRRFGQWPLFVRRMGGGGEGLFGELRRREGERSSFGQKLDGAGDEAGNGNGAGDGETRERKPQKQKRILTYCTGGIRCEKGVRYMQEKMNLGDNNVFTLKGGIAAYLSWVEEEIRAGRMTAADSLFKGKNYVFDARGAVGLEGAEPVSVCHGCGEKEGRLGKCREGGCHLVLVVCEGCEGKGVACCEDCGDIEAEERPEGAPRRICECERVREEELWRGRRPEKGKGQGWKTERRRVEMARRRAVTAIETIK